MTDIASLLSGGDGVQLSIFLTAGYPDVATCGALLDVLAAHPAVAFVELGMPFSDPLADGPTIQRASEVALAGGTKLDDVLAGNLDQVVDPLIGAHQAELLAEHHDG